MKKKKAVKVEAMKKALEEVTFRARGKWYDGRQVDEFIEKMIVAAEQGRREIETLQREIQNMNWKLETLKQENAHLWQELNAAKSAALSQPAPSKPIPPEQPSPEQPSLEQPSLEQQRADLLQDIKDLRRFRDAFRKAVEKDAGALADSLRDMDSSKLL